MDQKKLLRIFLFYFVLFILLKNVGFTQTFVDINANLPGLFSPSLAWGDYDNDGDLDILIQNYIFRNDGNDTFTNAKINFPTFTCGTVKWGDYDNDGDLDVITANLEVIKIYRNDENDNFMEIDLDLAGLSGGFVTWGDYDNDGDLDFLLCGASTDMHITTKIYRNDGFDTFIDINASLLKVFGGAGGLGDYDNDGDLDILLTGSTGYITTKLYRNDNNGIFTDVNTNMTNIAGGAAEFGDYDNDGDLDILLIGRGSSERTKLYRNDGNDTFIEVNTSLPDIMGDASWGDFDNDGNLDLLLSGETGTSEFSRIYLNDGGGIFTQLSNTNLAGLHFTDVALGDYDNDGDLDILLAGETDLGERITKVYRNDGLEFNNLPSPPTELSAVVFLDSVKLKWSRAVDLETSPAGLHYNVRIGTTPGGIDTWSPMADPQTGFRLIPALGNVNQDTTWSIQNLADGTYFWSVQTLDHNFAGSSFASEQSFTINGPPDPPQNVKAIAQDSIIIVSWDANLEPDLWLYHVYRRTFAGSIPLDSTTNIYKPDTFMIDTSVEMGKIYYYWVSAVDSSFNESEFSNIDTVRLNTSPV